MISSQYYCIADLHGRFDLFEKAMDKIAQRHRGSADVPKVIFLGDYIDRGPHSGEIIRALIQLEATGKFKNNSFEVVCLKGNHEEMLVADLHEQNDLFDPKILKSFGGSISDHVIDWLDNLSLYYIQDDNIFAHAYWNPNLSESENVKQKIPLSNSSSILWQRMNDDTPFNSEKYFLTHGHTPRKEGPTKARNRINLDTMAYKTGRLVVAVYKYNFKGPVDFIEVTEDT